MWDMAPLNCCAGSRLLINHESPDGYKRHPLLWNCGNGFDRVKLWRKQGRYWILIDDIYAESVNCEYGEYPLDSRS